MATGSKLQKYIKLLINLLPRGFLWQPMEQPTLKSLLDGVSAEPCRVDDRVQDLLREAFPNQSLELLEDWERVLGLPDECSIPDQNIQERRDQVVQKLTDQGGLSAERYEFLGQQLGFDIDVYDNHPFRAGESRAGDALTNSFLFKFVAGSRAGEQLTLSGWQFYFTVELPATASEIFRAGSRAGERLRNFENPLIQCTMRKLKPAHTAVFFRFTE